MKWCAQSTGRDEQPLFIPTHYRSRFCGAPWWVILRIRPGIVVGTESEFRFDYIPMISLVWHVRSSSGIYADDIDCLNNLVLVRPMLIHSARIQLFLLQFPPSFCDTYLLIPSTVNFPLSPLHHPSQPSTSFCTSLRLPDYNALQPLSPNSPPRQRPTLSGTRSPSAAQPSPSPRSEASRLLAGRSRLGRSSARDIEQILRTVVSLAEVDRMPQCSVTAMGEGHGSVEED
jgi:hypothetical protein